ncbi:outer membrane beta-barrel protein [Gammaproteobacteria bacterium]|nr:outer membrane beta-barrel protein [Gammaproteobacteria bacterium]
MKLKNIFLIFLFISIFDNACASVFTENADLIEYKYRHPGYLGVTCGYGATTWGYLVPQDKNEAMNLSTPTRVSENGTLWGLYGGYELNHSFAFEASYMHYPIAKVYFDQASLFTLENNLGGFVTHTQAISFAGKFMIVIPRNINFRPYSSVGIAGIHRDDFMANSWKVTPKFGVGLSYLLTDHMMMELGIDYLAGDGVSELNPAESFVPFLYSGFARLAMRL